MDHITSRRDLLRLGTGATACAMGGITIAAATLPSDAAATPPGMSPRLARAIALHERVNAAYDHFYETVEAPARKTFDVDVDALGALPVVPHESVETTFVNIFGDTVRLSTDRVGSIATARSIVSNPTAERIGDEAYQQAMRELAQLADARNAKINARKAERDATVRRLAAKHNLPVISARTNTLCDREADLRDAVMAIPALTNADLHAKVNFAERAWTIDAADHVLRIIYADVRRLVGDAEQPAS